MRTAVGTNLRWIVTPTHTRMSYPDLPATGLAAGSDAVAAVVLWALAGLVLLVILMVVLLLARRARHSRARRDRAVDVHDDPFRRQVAGEAAAGAALSPARSTAVERFRPPPAPSRMPWNKFARPRSATTVERPSPRGRWLIAAAVVLLLLVAGGGMIWWRHGSTDSPERAAVACPEAALHVSAAPEIAPVIQASARTLNPGGSDCGLVAVTAEEPDVTEAAAAKPDVWIPSSSAWLGVATTDGTTYVPEDRPLAYSPVVLAAPAALAAGFAKDGRASWAKLVGAVAQHQIPAVTMADPLHSTVGLLSVYAVRSAMSQTTPDAGIAELRALTLRSRLKDAAADPSAQLTRAAAETDPAAAVSDIGMFPVTEQQLTAYQHAGHPVALTGSLPADGPIDADYPYAMAKNNPHLALAMQLRRAITATALTAAGFRTAPTAKALALPAKAGALLGQALLWSSYQTLAFQVLVMIDASGSMNQRITDKAGHSTTKAALLRESGANAAQLFGEDTSVGLWFFSTPSPTSPAHVDAVPIGPVTGTVGGKSRRDLLGAAIERYQPTASAGTPLYQSVLDGEAQMRARAKPGTVTLVVVLTDGQDQQSRFSMTNQAFLTKLGATRDANRPVPILAIGYGADADMAALTAMARTTGGKAVAATDPADVASAMAQAFLAAHSPS